MKIFCKYSLVCHAQDVLKKYGTDLDPFNSVQRACVCEGGDRATLAVSTYCFPETYSLYLLHDKVMFRNLNANFLIINVDVQKRNSIKIFLNGNTFICS